MSSRFCYFVLPFPSFSIPFPFNFPIPHSQKAPQLTPKVSSKHGAFRSFGKLLPSHQIAPTEKPIQTDLGEKNARTGQRPSLVQHEWNMSGTLSQILCHQPNLCIQHLAVRIAQGHGQRVSMLVGRWYLVCQDEEGLPSDPGNGAC